jgi:hypothetical protein
MKQLDEATVAALVASCIELREAVAGAMRAFDAAATYLGDDTLRTLFITELRRSGVADGFGKRADDLLRTIGVAVPKESSQ